MNYLKIFLECTLQEHSPMSEQFSKYIFNMLFKTDNTKEIEEDIKDLFPIENDLDRNKLTTISSLIESITKISMNDFYLTINQNSHHPMTCYYLY